MSVFRGRGTSIAGVPPRWEVGSGFEWRDDLLNGVGTGAWLPPGHVFYSSGTGALLALERFHRGRRSRPVLHLPSYFCMEVADRLQTAFDLAWYQDRPNAPRPNLDTLKPGPGDWVLAVNLFGLRTAAMWKEWSTGQDDVIVVEDHTHDPLSPWARESIADYALASLRKTLPLPDGALLWSPRGLPLPTPLSPPPAAAHDHLAAMILKGAYLAGAGVAREDFRALYVRSEQSLSTATDAAASEFTASMLGRLPVARFREQRTSNVRLFLRLVAEQSFAEWEPLFTTWPAEAAPFNGLLLCRTTAVRDQLRQYLIERGVFCPIHWSQPAGGVASDDAEARELSRRLLTIPLDQRYGRSDVERIVEMLADFARGTTAKVVSMPIQSSRVRTLSRRR